ncbi:hypothetical protein [Micromonospora humidisoli]|nr:hypothetical protein [Micromonospora sp. AKA109]
MKPNNGSSANSQGAIRTKSNWLVSSPVKLTNEATISTGSRRCR